MQYLFKRVVDLYGIFVKYLMCIYIVLLATSYKLPADYVIYTKQTTTKDKPNIKFISHF